MKKITSLFVAFGLAASFAAAGEGDGCPGCKGADAKPTALATARQALADAKKADEKMPAEQRAELNAMRERMMQSSCGKAMGPSYEACGKAMLAAAVQPGTPAEAATLLKDMASTYCSLAKVFGGCAECKDCTGAGDACKGCAQMAPADIATKASESLASAKKLLANAMDEMKKMPPEEMQKMMADSQRLMKECAVAKAMQDVNAALVEGYASLAKMGIPSAEGKNGATDTLVKDAHGMHTMLTCEECESGEDAEETEEVEAPSKSS